jgi:hypothetical protein
MNVNPRAGVLARLLTSGLVVCGLLSAPSMATAAAQGFFFTTDQAQTHYLNDVGGVFAGANASASPSPPPSQVQIQTGQVRVASGDAVQVPCDVSQGIITKCTTSLYSDGHEIGRDTRHGDARRLLTTIRLNPEGGRLLAGSRHRLTVGAASKAQPAPAHAASAADSFVLSIKHGRLSIADRSTALVVTRGMSFYNLSSRPLRLVSLLDHDGSKLEDLESGYPALNSVLEPAQSDRFEVIYKVGHRTGAVAKYDVLDAAGQTTGKTVTLEMDINRSGYCGYLGASSLYTSSNYGESSIGLERSKNDFRLACGENPAWLADPSNPPTTVTVDGDKAQEQFDTLNQLCGSETNPVSTSGRDTESSVKLGDGSEITCKFSLADEKQIFTPSKVLGGVSRCELESGSCYHTVNETDTWGTTNSFGGEVGVEIAPGKPFDWFVQMKLTMKATYRHDATTSRSVSVTDGSSSYGAGYAIWVCVVNPVYRDTGDYTLHLKNTTWHLNGVALDTPDDSREPQKTVRDMKISELDSKYGGVPPC